jgi:hypothetical protein
VSFFGDMIAAGSVATAGPGSWDPTQLTNPAAMLLDHDSPVTDAGSGECSQWDDRSGNGFHAGQSGGSSARPLIVTSALNGHRILRFNGSSEYMTLVAGINTASANAGNLWAFAVYKNASSSAAIRNIINIGAPGSAVRFAFQASRTSNTDKPTLGVRRLDADSFANLSAATATGTSWAMAMVRMDYTNGDGFVDVNGTLADASNLSLTSTGSTSNTTAGTPTIGCSFLLAQFADMDLACLLFGTTLPTSADCDRLFGYYAHEYALTASLPALHPYKSVAP